MNRRSFLSILGAIPLLGVAKNQVVLDGTREACEFCGRPLVKRQAGGYIYSEEGTHPYFNIEYPEGEWKTCLYAMGDFVRANVKGKWTSE